MATFGRGGDCAVATIAAVPVTITKVRAARISRTSLLLLLPYRRIEPAQRLQIPNHVIEVAIAQTIGAKQRHRRGGAVDHRLHLVLLVALDTLIGIHDLHREEILVLLHAVNRRTAGRRDGDRLEPRPENFRA